MEYLSLIQWVISGFIIALVWFIRLESKVLFLMDDHSNHKKEVKENDSKDSDKIDKLNQGLTEIKISLARIEGSLIRLDEKKD